VIRSVLTATRHLLEFFVWISVRLAAIPIAAAILVLSRDFGAGGLGLAFVVIFAAFWIWLFTRDYRKQWKPDIDGENAYAVLGVRKSADDATIRRAFRRLTQKYHPDRTAPEERVTAITRFIRLNKAYELLSDPESRMGYDLMLEYGGSFVPALEDAHQELAHASKHPMFEIYAQWEREQQVTNWEEFEQRFAESIGEEPSDEYVDQAASTQQDVKAQAASPGDTVSECPACGWPNEHRGGVNQVKLCEQCGEEILGT
jgi:DnaJ-class molecular chaperone